MPCCCGQVFTCGSCANIPSDIAVTITSSGGNPLADVGCTFGVTSFVVSRPNGWYFPSPCLTCTGNGTLNNYWTTGSSVTTLIAEPNANCTPFQPPYYIAQGIVYCFSNTLILEWYCGTVLVSTPCGPAYRNPLPSSFGPQSSPLRFTSATINSCSPFAATLTGAYNGITYTASLAEVAFP